MQSFTVKLDLVTEYRYHGSHGPQTQKIKSGVASKAQQILSMPGTSTKSTEEKTGTESTSTKETPGSESGAEKKPNVAKAYGKHGGNIHVYNFLKEKVTETNISGTLNYISNLSAKFEIQQSWDVHTAKHKYSEIKSEIQERYLSKHGEVLSEQTANAYLIELKDNSFGYTQHFLRLVITSSEPFEGARFTKDQLYIRELRSKRIYSQKKVLLQPAVIKVLSEVTKEVNLEVVSNRLTRGGRFVVNSRTQRREFVIDFDQLGNRFTDTDDY